MADVAVGTATIRFRSQNNQFLRQQRQNIRSMQRARQAADAMRNSFLRIAAPALGFTAVAGLGRSFLQAASDAEEMRSKFQVVFRENADDVREWAATTAAAIGRSSIQLETLLANAQDLFVPFGFARDEAAELSQQLVLLAADLGSFNNIPFEQTFNRLRSALVGNHEAVQQLGILINESALNTELADEKYRELLATNENLAKVMARLNIAFRASSDAQGDAERTVGSFANRVQALEAAWLDLRTELGELFLPAATEGVRQLTEELRRLTDQVDTLDLERVRELWENFQRLGGALLTLFGVVTLFVPLFRVTRDLAFLFRNWRQQGELVSRSLIQIRKQLSGLQESHPVVGQYIAAFRELLKWIRQVAVRIALIWEGFALITDSYGPLQFLVDLWDKFTDILGAVGRGIVRVADLFGDSTEGIKEGVVEIEEETQKLKLTVSETFDLLQRQAREQERLALEARRSALIQQRDIEVNAAVAKNAADRIRFEQQTNALLEARAKLLDQIADTQGSAFQQNYIRQLEDVDRILEKLGNRAAAIGLLQGETANETIRGISEEITALDEKLRELALRSRAGAISAADDAAAVANSLREAATRALDEQRRAISNREYSARIVDEHEMIIAALLKGEEELHSQLYDELVRQEDARKSRLERDALELAEFNRRQEERRAEAIRSNQREQLEREHNALVAGFEEASRLDEQRAQDAETLRKRVFDFEHALNIRLAAERTRLLEEQRQLFYTTYLQPIETGMIRAFNNILYRWDFTWRSMGEVAKNIIADILSQLLRLSVVQPLINALGAYVGLPGLGAGGPPALAAGGIGRGFTLVGERGPELVDFRTPSRVYSAEDTGRLFGGGVTLQNTFNITGSDEKTVRKAIRESLPGITRSVKVAMLSRPAQIRRAIR